MSEVREFSDLIGDIYDASLDPALWPPVFEQICRFLHCSSAHLFAQDYVGKTANRYFTWGDEPGFTQLYIDKYAKINPMFPGALFFNVEEVHQLVEIIPREEVRRTRFCIEWMAPQEIIDDMFIILEKSATTCSLFQVVRRRSEGTIDERARQRMALLAPHIRRSVLIGKVIDLKKVEAAALADSFDTLSAGMFMVDSSGRIVHANASGHSMLEEAKVLRSVGGHLGAIDATANHSLLESFATAENGDAGLGRKGIAVPLQARGEDSYVANVLPMTSGARRNAGISYCAVATIFVHKAALDLSPPEALAKQFKLTPAELRVLFALIEMGGVRETGEVLGISEATTRTHLRHLFEKTGTSRQTELIKLVAKYANPLVH